jgi:hypothetical protein
LKVKIKAMAILHTPEHEEVSLQISKFGTVTNLSSANFSLSGNHPFLIKNDGEAAVTLEVMPESGSAYVSTVFQVGWNPEIVKSIKKTSGGGTLLWGY